MKSHILAQLTFGPWRDDADEAWKESVEYTLESFLGNLLRCSQIIGQAIHGVIDGAVQAHVRLPRADALDTRHMSKYARAWLAKLESLLDCPMDVRFLTQGDGVEDKVDWRQAAWLILLGADTDGIAPVRDQSKACVPSYLLPIDADNMERICFWARDKDRHYSLWFSSMSLEKETFIALADPKSDLNIQARGLAAMVEKAIGKPTYTHLFRHYALPDDKESNRLCPLCGGSWKVEGETFEFRCAPCRLISNLGPSTDEGEHANELARVGVWQGGRR
jgi:predicted  nucleic acid-binding Zn ribbon protein